MSEKTQILVVDDDARTLALIRRALRRVGYDVLTADSAEKALSLAAGKPVEIAIVDLKLPDMPGFELISALRQSCPGASFIIITGYASVDTAIEAVGTDVAVYLEKPFTGDEIRRVTGDTLAAAAEKRRKAQDALLNAAREWQATFDSISDATAVLASDGIIVQCNRAMGTLLGRHPAALAGRTCWEVVHASSEPIPDCPFVRAQNTGRREEQELFSNGRWLNVVVDPIIDSRGNMDRAVHIMRDVTKRKHVEESLRAIFNGVLDGILAADPQTHSFVACNDAMCRMLGYTREEILGLVVADIHPREATPMVEQVFRDQVAGRRKLAQNLPVLRKDGSVFYADINSAATMLDGRQVLMGVFRDTTQAKELTKAVADASLRERERLRGDIHDGVCQQLTGLELLVGNLADSLAETNPAASAKAMRILELVKTSSDTARKVAAGLEPVGPEPEALYGALHDLAAETTDKYGLKCRFSPARRVLLHNHNAASNLYLIAQEAVRNACGHARARHIELALTRARKRVRLAVNDDGVGLPKQKKTREKMGLSIMRYRASSIGATLTIEENRPKGTSVICEWIDT